MRREASRPPAATPVDAIDAPSPKMAALAKPRCNSCNEDISRFQAVLCAGRFVQQHLEWGKIDVPFDQRWPGPESFDRVFIQRPHFRRDARTVRVDQARSAGVKTRQMDLIDASDWNRR